MRLITVAGPPSGGKTSVLLKTLELLKTEKTVIGVIKFDCHSTSDDRVLTEAGVISGKGLAGVLCPDHYFVSNLDSVIAWGEKHALDIVIIESAGLCNRCSPHLREHLAICVVDNVSGLNTPSKIGPMLKLADIVVITKGDIVSQAEREVFAYRVQQIVPRARIVPVNGRTGQGAFTLSKVLLETTSRKRPDSMLRLRFPMPAALCSYCLGETRVGADYQIGQFKKLELE